MLLDRLIQRIPDGPKRQEKPNPIQQVAQSLLFDEAFYMQKQEVSSGKPMLPAKHYVEYGGAQRLDPHPWFDTQYYLSQVGDVESPLIHYLESGMSKGISPHPSFDPDQLPVIPHVAKRGTALEDHLRYVVRYGQKAITPNAYQSGDPLAAPILLDFHNQKLNFEHGRYTFMIIAMCRDLGHPILTLESDDTVKYAERFRFFQTMLDDGYVKVLKHESEIPKNVLRFTDAISSSPQKSTLVWRRGIPKDRNRDMVWPVPMHPAQYLRCSERNLRWLRQRPRNTRILFSGEVNWKYRIPLMQMRHGKTPRQHLVSILRNQFKSYIDTNHYRSFRYTDRIAGAPPILVLDQRTDRIPSNIWLDRLRLASFFISAPGAYFPMAHNSTEAMAVGTIPILEFPEYFSPALEDGVNCLTYNGKDGFAKTIERALNMSEAEIATMREAAIAYYEEHTDILKFTQKLIKASEEGADFYFHFEYPLS
ncbi:hypothetical protein [Rubellicoccus peritrichatus]|uniref:Uncharacterized protein n=1 Tax=Rubellicoccus peritrichatus TaxID=3080537 RepID=A0AAQ3L7S6_9BACT|nr:hypothetical protein [Puniceicoccus sp. CR14]WOO39444.1 hypothetical protein RZN69_12540 [Puniceicoccus sp. CR14]